MARNLLRDSWPLIFSCIVIMIYLRIDQVMLGEMAGSEAVGVYSVAVRLTEVWFFIPTAVYWSVLPSLVEARQNSDELFYGRLQKYYNLMALTAYVIAIPVMLLANWLVLTLFGAPYAEAGLMLAVMIWANLFTFLEIARSAFFNVMNWNRIYFVTLALGAALNVVLNLLLIPRYGGLGAAIATCASYWFAAHGSCFLYKPLRRTGFHADQGDFLSEDMVRSAGSLMSWSRGRTSTRVIMLVDLMRYLVRRKVKVEFNDLTRNRPVSTSFGCDRGTPIDRYYIEKFLAAQADLIRGRVLEVGEDTYSRRFGGGQVESFEVLNATLRRTIAAGDCGRSDRPCHPAGECHRLLHLHPDLQLYLRCRKSCPGSPCTA